MTWEQFARAWKLVLGTLVIAYAVRVLAQTSPGAMPYALATGLGLIGVTITFPWERKNRDDE